MYTLTEYIVEIPCRSGPIDKLLFYHYYYLYYIFAVDLMLLCFCEGTCLPALLVGYAKFSYYFIISFVCVLLSSYTRQPFDMAGVLPGNGFCHALARNIDGIEEEESKFQGE